MQAANRSCAFASPESAMLAVLPVHSIASSTGGTTGTALPWWRLPVGGFTMVVVVVVVAVQHSGNQIQLRKCTPSKGDN